MINMKKISMELAVECLQKGDEIIVERKDGSKYVATKDSFFTVETLCNANFYVESIKEITLPLKEYKRLLDRVEFLNCLEACGVDNWHGYGEAWQMMNEEGEEE